MTRRGVTLELLWEEYRADHPDDGYGYSHFCDLYRDRRGVLDVVMRQEHRAGEKLFVDWAGMTMSIVDATTGEVTERPVFVAALGTSSFTYAEVFESQALRCWIAEHIHTFACGGGVTAVTVSDDRLRDRARFARGACSRRTRRTHRGALGTLVGDLTVT